MSDLFHVSASPHTRSPITTRKIMQYVVLSLVPASLFGIANFGINALLVIVTTVAATVLTEYIYCRLMKLNYNGDFSDVVTGLLLALNLPSGIPLWIAILGGVFAILVVKMVFGGLGQNFMNPALAARAFLLISFPVRMTDYTVNKLNSFTFIDYFKHGMVAVDGVSGATPLAALKAGQSVDIMKMFIGNIGGTIGETSALALLIGAAYLFFKKIISPRIPLSYILSFAVFILLFGPKGFDLKYLFAQIVGGGLILGAFFMATDYVTSPTTPVGQIVFGIFLGVLTGIFRVYGGSAEGVSFAIIFGNCLVPLIEKMTLPRYFGKERVSNGK